MIPLVNDKLYRIGTADGRVFFAVAWTVREAIDELAYYLFERKDHPTPESDYWIEWVEQCDLGSGEWTLLMERDDEGCIVIPVDDDWPQEESR